MIHDHTAKIQTGTPSGVLQRSNPAQRPSSTGPVNGHHPSGRRSRRQEIRTFATTTNALLELRDWLVAEKVTLVVMEATGGFETIVAAGLASI